MDATTMPKTSSLASLLQAAFPQLLFKEAADVRWSPDTLTVYYQTGDGSDAAELLHETAHGLLDHINYSHDVTLLKMERDAWTYAKEILAPQFNVEIDDDFIEDALDTYRSWLHARSLCPHCDQTGIQNSDDSYLCLGCDQSWRTNEARQCELRRYKITTKTPAL